MTTRRFRRFAALVPIIILAAIVISSASRSSREGARARPFMGFPLYPNIYWSSSPDRFVGNLYARADLLSIHWDAGIPWEIMRRCPDLAACQLAQGPLSDAYQAFHETIEELVPHARIYNADPNKRVYLAVSPLSSNRDGIAPNYQSEAVPPPADTFADAELRTLYRRFVLYLMEQFEPDVLSPGIEINMYLRTRPGDFDSLLTLMREVRADGLGFNDSLLIAPTLQWEFYQDSYLNSPSQRDALLNMLANWGTLGSAYFFSTYPNLGLGLRTITLEQFNFADFGFHFDATTRLMISETGIQPELQEALLDTLFDLAELYDMYAIVWFFLEDADSLPLIPSLQNVGLLDDAAPEYLQPHPGLNVWDEYFIGSG